MLNYDINKKLTCKYYQHTLQIRSLEPRLEEKDRFITELLASGRSSSSDQPTTPTATSTADAEANALLAAQLAELQEEHRRTQAELAELQRDKVCLSLCGPPQVVIH